MPTPADLREALVRLEAEAPDAAATRAAVLRRIGSTAPAARPRWTFRAGPLLVAAVAVLVVLATVLVLSVRGGAGLGEPVGRPTPPPAVELTWTFDLPDPPPGTTFRRDGIGPVVQTGTLHGIDTDADLTVFVRAPGSFDPRNDLLSPQPVTVAGQPGFSGKERADQPYASLVWPTPAGGWAQIYGFGVTTTYAADRDPEPAAVLADQLAIAPLVTFGRFGSPSLPFRLGWRPSGLSVQAMSRMVATRDGTSGAAIFGDGAPGSRQFGTITVARQDAVSGSFDQEIKAQVGPDRTPLTVRGRPAVLGPAVTAEGPTSDARVLAVDLGDGSALLVYVAQAAADRYPDDVLRRIAEEADVSMSLADPSTWVPAPEAVSG